MIFTQLSLFSLLAVFASSAVAAMGLGGGTVLLLYLSFFSALSQPQMQAALSPFTAQGVGEKGRCGGRPEV